MRQTFYPRHHMEETACALYVHTIRYDSLHYYHTIIIAFMLESLIH